MIIHEAAEEIRELDLHERSKYSFRNLAQQVAQHETDEPFALTGSLVEAGLCIEPFWNNPEDIEGRCYLPYIKTHPDFGLTVRQSLFDHLVKASRLLPADWQLVVKAGFRPYDVQLAVLDAFVHESAQVHPEWTNEQHLQQARTYVADPRIVCPPHVTGGAVDLAVKDVQTGKYIDMGCPPNTDSEVAFLHSDLVTQEQYKNRMTLLTAMLEAGFAPNAHEWWHYQYGETYWAAFYGHDVTLYGLVL